MAHGAKKVAAKVVGLVHKDLAKKIHDPAKTSLKTKIREVEEKHMTEIDDIHAHYKAERPSVYQIADRQVDPRYHRSAHYDEPAPTGYVQHHESDYHAPPHSPRTPVPSAPPLRHDSGSWGNTHYREGTQSHHSDMW